MKNFQNQTTILLIESNSDWLMDVYLTLQAEGYDVLIATGGDQGFCAARRVRPDLILCDAALPDISGTQLCYMVRADKNLRSALFMLIGDADNQSGDNALEGFCAGADDFFESDCNRQFMAAKIERFIALRRSEAELRRRCQILQRSERRLAEVIKVNSISVAALEPPLELAAFDANDSASAKGFFSRNSEPEKTSDALESWKQALQPKESSEPKKIGREKREKIYYEIVC